MPITDALSVLVLVSRSIVLAWFLNVFRTAGESILYPVSQHSSRNCSTSIQQRFCIHFHTFLAPLHYIWHLGTLFWMFSPSVCGTIFGCSFPTYISNLCGAQSSGFCGAQFLEPFICVNEICHVRSRAASFTFISNSLRVRSSLRFLQFSWHFQHRFRYWFLLLCITFSVS